MSKDTGGQAFPSPCRSVADEMVNLEYRGMSLRDYFAAKAMQGILVKSADSYLIENIRIIWSEYAYKIADAMLKERAK